MTHKEHKREEQFQRSIREQAEEIDQRIIVGQYLAEMRRIQREDDERREYWEQSEQFLQHMARTKPYRVYLIAYDLVYHDHFNIENDLRRGKILFADIERVVTESKEYITSQNDFNAKRFKTA